MKSFPPILDLILQKVFAYEPIYKCMHLLALFLELVD